MRLRQALAGAVGLLALAAGACRRAPAPPWRGMNIVWISLDSVRADHCSFEGYARNTTPRLDRIASGGVHFSRCIAQAPYTLPSYASMLSSRYVAELAVTEQRDGTDRSKILSIAPGPSPSDVLISEALRAGGYRTGAFVQSWVSQPMGFDQGWDTFRHAQETLKEKLPHVTEWIEKNRDHPFFAFVYSTDTHYPFLHAHPDAPRDLYGRFERPFEFTLEAIQAVRAGTLRPTARDMESAMAMYDEGLHATDADLAALFDYLERAGLASRTIVVFNADHGEEFFEHGVISHGQTYFDPVVRTPLVIAAPGASASGRGVDALVQNLDVAPTLLDLVGVARPEAWSGRSLAWALSGQPDPSPRGAFSEGAWSFWIGAAERDGKKFILVSPRERMLFDLARDPGEKDDLASRDTDAVRALYHALMKHLGAPPSGVTASGPAPSYDTWIRQVMGHYGLSEDSEVVKELRSLGYLQ